MQSPVLLCVQISLGCGHLAGVQYAPWCLGWPRSISEPKLWTRSTPTYKDSQRTHYLSAALHILFWSYGRNAHGDLMLQGWLLE